MKISARALVLVAAAFVLGACAPYPGKHHGPGSMRVKSSGSAGIFWCDCGPQCECKTLSTKSGKCSCGKDLAGGHVVFMEGNTALVCTCGPACTCAIDPKDHTMCGCGKPVKRVDLEGTGLYFCNCGGSCACNTISEGPGPCGCGMKLHQAR